MFVDREHGRPLTLDDDFHDSVRRVGRRPARARAARARCATGRCDAVRPWPLRASDFDVLDHVNNARSLEAIEDELDARLPGRVARRARIEYRGTIERGDAVELASDVRADGERTSELAAWLSVDGEVRCRPWCGHGRRSDAGHVH